VIEKFASEIGQAREYSQSGIRETVQVRKGLMDYLPKSVDELPPRRMKDSFVSAIIPLKNKLDIRERYVTVEGHVRIGRVIEDMDVFAGYTIHHYYRPTDVKIIFIYSILCIQAHKQPSISWSS